MRIFIAILLMVYSLFTFNAFAESSLNVGANIETWLGGMYYQGDDSYGKETSPVNDYINFSAFIYLNQAYKDILSLGANLELQYEGSTAYPTGYSTELLIPQANVYLESKYFGKLQLGLADDITKILFEGNGSGLMRDKGPEYFNFISPYAFRISESYNSFGFEMLPYAQLKGNKIVYFSPMMKNTQISLGYSFHDVDSVYTYDDKIASYGNSFPSLMLTVNNFYEATKDNIIKNNKPKTETSKQKATIDKSKIDIKGLDSLQSLNSNTKNTTAKKENNEIINLSKTKTYLTINSLAYIKLAGGESDDFIGRTIDDGNVVGSGTTHKYGRKYLDFGALAFFDIYNFELNIGARGRFAMDTYNKEKNIYNDFTNYNGFNAYSELSYTFNKIHVLSMYFDYGYYKYAGYTDTPELDTVSGQSMALYFEIGYTFKPFKGFELTASIPLGSDLSSKYTYYSTGGNVIRDIDAPISVGLVVGTKASF